MTPRQAGPGCRPPSRDSSGRSSGRLGSGAVAVEIYPAPPAARRSRSHRVRVLGRATFVERHAGVNYARFAMRGNVALEIEVARPITRHTIFPAERVASTSVAGNVLRLELAAPESVVVWIDELERLFLLPDPLEIDPPIAGSPGVLDVTEYGADRTGRSPATTAIQAAIDRATEFPGGGTVYLPRGLFRTGTLTLRSNVTFYVAPGSLLQGSSDPSDYPVDRGRHESAADTTLPPDQRYHGRTMTFTRLLLVEAADNVRIGGRGTIDGAGTFLRTKRNIAPNLVRVRQSTNIAITDVLFRNAAAWSIHLLASRGVACRNVKIINDRANLNTDGIDPDMSAEVTIDHSFIYTRDDAICVKATGNSDLSGNPEHIVVSNNLVSSVDAALKIGSESEAARFSEITFERNHVFDSGRAMSLVVRDGATYQGVTFRGIRVGPNVEHLIEQVIGVREPAAALGQIRELTFDDVVAPAFARPAGNWTWYAGFRPGRPRPGDEVNVFEGADRTHGIDGLRFRGLIVNGQHLRDPASARIVAGLTIGPHVRNVTFD